MYLQPTWQMKNAALQLADELQKKHSTIDAALLLAGGFTAGDIHTVTAADFEQQLQINFYTAFHIGKALFKQMMQNNYGKIILIGSKPALDAQAGKQVIAYGLSKSLLLTFAEYLNATARGKNVSVTVVAPSTIDTPANRKAMPHADFGAWILPQALAESFEFIVEGSGQYLRETVLKMYNNA